MELSIVKKRKNQLAETTADIVVEESCFQLYIENRCLEEFYCFPADFKALALGYLLAEGLITQSAEVLFGDDIVKSESGNYRWKIVLQKNSQETEVPKVVSGSGAYDLFSKESTDINWERAMGYAGELLQISELFRSTGCIHAAALCRDGELCYTGEDISRFFAMYKAIGKACMNGENLSSFVLCTTGRLPMPYMKRVVQCGIRCVISRSAPTDLSIEYANQYGVAVFGFADAGKINYYPVKIEYCLLAGGEGNRAEGADKALFTYCGHSFADTIVNAMGAEGEIMISYNRTPNKLPTVIGGKTVRIISDITPAIGPLGGIYTILKQSKSGAVLFAPCDLPFYSEQIARICRMRFTGLEDAVVMMTGDKLQPLCAIYTKACIPVIEEMIAKENYRIRDLLKGLKVTYINALEHGIAETCFTNINTLQEYEMI